MYSSVHKQLCLRISSFIQSVSSSLLCNTVSFPFTEPLVRLVVDYLEPGKAMDFLAKSASKIIAARKMDSDHSALVNVWFY